MKKKEGLRMTNEEIKIAEHYGINNQMLKLIEESGELIQAIIKKIICEPTEEINNHLIEELADTTLVLDQVIYLIGCKDKVSKIRKYKATRTIERMG